MLWTKAFKNKVVDKTNKSLSNLYIYFTNICHVSDFPSTAAFLPPCHVMQQLGTLCMALGWHYEFLQSWPRKFSQAIKAGVTSCLLFRQSLFLCCLVCLCRSICNLLWFIQYMNMYKISIYGFGKLEKICNLQCYFLFLLIGLVQICFTFLSKGLKHFVEVCSPCLDRL